MTTCTSCGNDVTGKKFCQNCGTPAPVISSPAAPAAQSFCTNCGRKGNPGEHFCSGCGTALGEVAAAGAPVTQAAAQPTGDPYSGQPQPYANATQYGQPQYPPAQYPQQYSSPQYGQQGQMGYQPEPMLGQQPMVLRCPVCMAMAPLGTPSCPSCRTSLAGIVPTPATMPQQGGMQQGGLGGMLQGRGGNMAMGALGGAAAVIGGEMLLGGLERRFEGDDGYGYGEEHRHHHREEGMLGGLGELGQDIGLF
jgi:Double zinc ribbon